MRIKLFILIAVLLFVELLAAQNKRDYVWMMGTNTGSDPGIENFMFDFNRSYFEVIPINGALGFNMNNAIVSDYEGNLLFYSNGCAVANRNHEIMPNGEDINEGDWFELFWGGDCGSGYPGTQDILAIPDPYYELGYYLVSKPFAINENAPNLPRDIQYSYIDMALEDGLGDVIIKNQVIYNLDTIQSSYLHALKHSNERDWWVIQPSEEKNRILKFLIDESGFHFYDVQEIGADFHVFAGASGKGKFSPNGSNYAYYNPYDQFILYDFDRTTGQLSGRKEMFIDSIPIFNAIEYSASGQYLYFALKTKLYQLDVWNMNDPNALVLIDNWNEVLDPFPTSFFLMQRGPDCRIYMCSQSSTNTYHVINKPDEKGIACEFEQQGIQLPYISGIASFPNFPNFRIDEDEVCDPSLTSLFDIPIETRKGISLSPNPTYDYLNLSLSSELNINSIDVYTSSGQKLKSFYNRQERIDVSDLSLGMYILKVNLVDGSILAEKFIKI